MAWGNGITCAQNDAVVPHNEVAALVARVGDGVVVLVADVGGEVAHRCAAHGAGCAPAAAATALVSVAAELLFAAEVLALLAAATALPVLTASAATISTATAVTATTVAAAAP